MGGAALVVGGAFWYGSLPSNPVNNNFYLPRSTPTPDNLVGIGQAVRVGDLELTVVNAWRIWRPGPDPDLGILTVKFGGTKACDDPDDAQGCTFYKNRFQLVNGEGKIQSLSGPPSKYIAGMKILNLVPARALGRMESETGQIFFLLDKNSEEFTLKYQTPNGEEVNFNFVPKVYEQADMVKNLTTTPQPEYGEIKK